MAYNYRYKNIVVFKKNKITLTLFLLLNLFCYKLDDMLGPYTPSRVTVKGKVLDQITHFPIKKASIKVESIAGETFTDDSGLFKIDGVKTGINRFFIVAQEYKDIEVDFDITLSPFQLTIFLERKDKPPTIETFFVEKENLRFCDDSIKIIFTVTDSSGGISRVALFSSENPTILLKTYNFKDKIYFFADTFKYISSFSGLQNLKLIVVDNRDYIAEDSISFTVPSTKRPKISLIRFPEGGFISGEWGYVEVFIDDPDSVFSFLSINWNDGGDTVISHEREGVYWRKISIKETTEWKINIKIFCGGNLTDDTIVTFPVRVISPPLLDDKIFLNPRYCAPHDTVITIGVNVLSVEKGSYVKEILWIINENESSPFFTFFREKFDEGEGKVPPKGRLFTHIFLINNFKGTNIVKIIVTDSNGYSSIISGVFYVAGKPE